MYEDFSAIFNRPLALVHLTDSKDKIIFHFQDGTAKAYGVEGDCCSRSWIEHLEGPSDITGAIITSVDNGYGVPWDGHECKPESDRNYAPNICGHDVLAVYHTNFNTNKGTVVLEFRNDSNGYYGGYLVDADTGERPGQD